MLRIHKHNSLEDEDEDLIANPLLAHKSLPKRDLLDNPRFSGSTSERAKQAADFANKLNNEFFDTNHAEFLGNKEHKAKIDKERNFETVAVSTSKDGKEIIIAGNIKKRTEYKRTEESKKKQWISSEFGIKEDQHKGAIQRVIKEEFPALKTSEIVVVQPKIAPTTKEENAKFHAEQQILSYVDDPSKLTMGVNKPPCGKCAPVLNENGVTSAGHHGKSLEKVVNFMKKDPQKIEPNFKFRNNKVSFDHNWHTNNKGVKGVIKSMTKVSLPKVPNQADVGKKIKAAAVGSVTPTPAVSVGAGLETIINNIMDTDGRAHAELGHASAGKYTTKCSKGIYARASTAEASASWNVFSASANGPAASAGLHCGVGTWASAYANAEVARAEAVAGPVSVGVGLNVSTGVSVGLDGVNASLLGFGVSFGPKMSVRTPVADVSCSIM